MKSRCPMLLLLRLLVDLSMAVAAPVFEDSNSALASSEHSKSDSSLRSSSCTLEPSSARDMNEGEFRTFMLKIRVNGNEWRRADEDKWTISADSLHSDVAEVNALFTDNSSTVSNDSTLLDSLHRPLSTWKAIPIAAESWHHDDETGTRYVDGSVVVNGKLLGKTSLRVRIGHEDEDPKSQFTAECSAEIWVSRGPYAARLNGYFVSVLAFLIAVANIMMGCELDLNAVFETIRRPIAPMIGFCTQFLVMPLLAYSIAHMVFVGEGLYSFALGLFVTGCAPGGGASNFWTILLDGNAHLSVTMTFLSTIASLVMMPLWLWALGGQFLQGDTATGGIRVPYYKILASLASLVGPLLIGVAIKKWRPTWAERVRPILRPFIIFTFIFIIAFGTYVNSYMFSLMSVRALIGGLLLPWCGFACGCFSALLTRRPPKDVTAIAVETGIQNTGIAILLLKLSFAEPDGDIAALLPIIVACFTPGPLLLGVAVHHVIQRTTKGKKTLLPSDEPGQELKEIVKSGCPALDAKHTPSQVPLLEERVSAQA